MRTIRTVLAVLLLVSGLAGCQRDPEAVPEQRPPGTAADAEFPRTVEHAMGATEIPAEPVRIVALDQTFVDAAVSLQSTVVGYTVFDGMDAGRLPTYLGDGLQYAEDAVGVGQLAEPDLEKIATLEPDLILSAKIRHQPLYGQLSEIAPTVFSDGTGAQWRQILQLVGEATGKEQLATDLLADFDQRAATIGASIAEDRGDLPEISVARFAGEPGVRLYGRRSYAGEVLAAVGFPRPKAQPDPGEDVFVQVSPENVDQLDAEMIFVSSWADPAVAETKQPITSGPLWKQLSGEKHVVDDEIWMTAVGLQGAHALLDDVAHTFRVELARDSGCPVCHS